MQIVANDKLIKRNKRIGQITTIASLAVLIGGLIASFTPEYLYWSFAALIGGFLLSQVGIYFGNRWGRSPRTDEVLTSALKGLGDQYTLYHYTSPVPHLLVGPSGILVLLPYYQAGTITYDAAKNRWKQKGGNWYLKLFGQESLGRPDLEAASYISDMQKWLSRNFPGQTMPTPEAILVFTNPKADVQIDNAPLPAMMEDKLKDFIRRKTKTSSLPVSAINTIQAALPAEEQPEKSSKTGK